MREDRNEDRNESGSKEENHVLVSVIIPAYHCAESIGRAIDSALEQEVPLEILIINDGSDDGTEAAIEPYRKNPAIRYFANEKNLGAARSRNRGVALARGKFVAFLDADDWWERGKLKKQLLRMKRERAVLCCTARALVDSAGKPLGKIIPVKERITYRQLLSHNSINCSSVVLLKRVALEFPMEHEDSHEDYIAWLRILKKYGFACGINEPLLNYRLSLSGKSGGKLKSARMTFAVYRYLGFGLLPSVCFFCSYALHGIWKYR